MRLICLNRSDSLLGVTLLLVLGVGACQTAPPGTPGPASMAAVSDAAAGDSAAFVFALSNQTWCSNREATTLVLMMMGRPVPAEGFAAQRGVLAEADVLPADWSLDAAAPVTKGTLAYMLCQALGLRGGVMMHLLPGPRYAYREAVYLGLMDAGSDYEPVSGPEAVGILGRAARADELPLLQLRLAARETQP